MADGKLRYQQVSTPQASVVVVVSHHTWKNVSSCVGSLRDHSDVPLRVTAVLDGVTKDAVQAVAGKGVDVMSNVQPRYFRACLLQAFDRLHEGQLGVILPVNLWVIDRSWFGLVLAPYHADRTTGLVFFGDETPNASAVPHRVERAEQVPEQRIGVAIAPTFVERMAAELGADQGWDDVTYRSRMVDVALRSGCTVWSVPTVRVVVGARGPRHVAPVTDAVVPKVGASTRGPRRDS